MCVYHDDDQICPDCTFEVSKAHKPYVADVTRYVIRCACNCGWRAVAHTPKQRDALLQEHAS